MGLSTVFPSNSEAARISEMPKQSGLVDKRESAICARIKDFRESIRWPQPAFAYELQLSKNQLASIEYGRTPLRWEVGYRLCVMFDVNAHWLATGEGPVTPYLGRTTEWFPGNLPKKILFSEVYDSALKDEAKLQSEVLIQTKSGAEREMRDAEGQPRGKDELPAGRGGGSLDFMRYLLELLETERFHSDEEKAAFVREIYHLARVLSLKHRARRTRRFLRSKTTLRSMVCEHDPDLSGVPTEKARRVMEVKSRLLGLDADYLMLANDYEELTGEVWSGVPSETNSLTSQSSLTMVTTGMKKQFSSWPELKEALISMTKERGGKAALARQFNVTPQAVSEWMRGISMPSADTTIRLLSWVAGGGSLQQKSPGAGATAPEPKTQPRTESQNENQTKSGRKKR